jgi:FkbM family methyltransferase
MSVLNKLTDPKALSWAVRKRLFSAAIAREAVVSQGELEHLGTAYGGFTVPTDRIEPGWMAWSAGAGNDVSFDVELLRRFGARVRSFDPFQRHLDAALEQAKGLDGYSIHHVAIASTDGPVTLWGSDDPDEGMVSSLEQHRAERSFVAEGRTIPSLAAELGDQRIDLLKLAIEGAEYDVLASLDPRDLGVRMLCVEVNETVSPRVARGTIDGLRGKGYTLVAREGRKLTFIHSQ